MTLNRWLNRLCIRILQGLLWVYRLWSQSLRWWNLNFLLERILTQDVKLRSRTSLLKVSFFTLLKDRFLLNRRLRILRNLRNRGRWSFVHDLLIWNTSILLLRRCFILVIPSFSFYLILPYYLKIVLLVIRNLYWWLFKFITVFIIIIFIKLIFIIIFFLTVYVFFCIINDRLVGLLSSK